MVDFKAMAEKARQRREQEAMSKHTDNSTGTTFTSGPQDKVDVKTEAPLTSGPKVETIVSPPNAVAVVEPAKAALPEKFFAPSEMEEMAGAGLENVKATDTLLPRLTILQALSPQLNKKKVEFIEGAAVGDWCDVSIGEVFKDSVEIIPCHFIVQYIKWKKNRGGFLGNLGADARVLRDTTLNDKRQHVTPEGDVIAETAHWYVMLHVGMEWRRAFLPFSSTGLKVSRKWHSLIGAEVLFGSKGPFKPPLYYRPWTLKVATESNDQGDWYLAAPTKTPRNPEDITDATPEKERYKTIYNLMAEAGDADKWLLNECKAFYIDARDNLVVGDMGQDDANDPANARIVGGSGTSIDDQSRTL